VTTSSARPDAPLSGLSALVTGASSGIGRAVALALSQQGVRLLLVGRREGVLREVADETSGATIVVADLATDHGRRVVTEALPSSLNVLVHSAGIHAREPVATTTGAAWTEMSAVNLHAPLLLTAACLPALRTARGHVVFVNSTASLQPVGAKSAAYAASKHGLRAATDALRQEVNADGIRVLSIYPGRTDTPMQDAILAQEGRVASPDALLRPEDVAAMILAALMLPSSAEVTDITLRPARPL
jgi:short-subunit dehydrogenase